MTTTFWHQLRGFFEDEYHRMVAFVRNLIADAADREAEDIVQEVAFHLFEKGDIAAPIEHLGAYIYQSLRNRVTDSFRRKKPDRSLDEPIGDGEGDVRLVDVIADTTSDTVAEAESRDYLGHAMEYIKRMPERDQAIIIATEIEGYSFAELSQRWNVPVGTLLARKSRSLKKVRDYLQTLT